MGVSLTALMLVALSSLGWAGMDALRKSLGQRMAATSLVVWLMGLQSAIFAGWALATSSALPTAGYLWPGLGSLSLNMISSWMFIRAVSTSPLSLTIPMLSLTPVFTALMAIPILGERPSIQQTIGICVVVAGALVLGLGRARTPNQGDGLFKALTHERGTLLMIGVALLWSVVAPLDKQALSYARLPVHAAIQNGGIAIGLGLLLVLRGTAAELKAGLPHRWLILVTAIVGTAALGLQLSAYTLTLVSLVEAIKRGLGMALAVASGWRFFDEPITAAKLAAIALMVLGTCLLIL